MKITLVGAAGGEVTGSCYLVETKQARIMIDCGLFQGGKKSEALNKPPTAPNRTLDAVLLTHGHLDHTGRLPLLAKMGYAGPIFGTPATLDMTGLILRDSARLQVADNERKNRKRLRAGEPQQEPLYTPDDAEKILSQLRPAPYKIEFEIASDIKAIWHDAGHMLGSASIQLIVEEDGKTKRVVPGGIGTLLELSLAWQLLQVSKLYNTPLILVGKMWAELVEWGRRSMLQKGNELASEIDFKIPHCVNTMDECIALIRENRDSWLAAQTIK
jgi:Metallo-beta-lactamase superfamily/Possible lysine decarboxylase